MTLLLSVLRCPDAVTPETREVRGGEFCIGRGPDNDWVLPDPERHLSKRHCVIAFRSGGWQLADISTNGTFLNGDSAPIGSGTPRALQDGDRLRLGPYEIEVRISADALGLAGIAPMQPQAGMSEAEPFEDTPFASPFVAEADPASRAEGPASEAAFPPMALPADYDPLAPDPADAPFAGPSEPDHAPAIEDAFRPPREARPLLPDDWDLDDPSVNPPIGASAPTGPVAAVPSPLPASESVESVASAAVEPALLAAFLRGAGVPDAKPADPSAAMAALGAAFRAMVSGLRRALIARAEIKGEFRIEQTMVRPRGNNPLKFSANDEDALAALLSVGRRTDMGPAQAVSDALNDIRLHELASITAMQTAVRALLARFDPAALRGSVGDGGLIASAAGRKARAWDAFEKLHAEVAAALEDDFDSVFGKAFARAYEQALGEIAAREEP